MTKALILNEYDDVKDCLKYKRQRDCKLFTTHPSVQVYLNSICGLECKLLSEYHQVQETGKWIEQIDVAVDRLLADMDNVITESMESTLGFKMNCLTALYAYFTKHQYLGYLCLIEAVKRLSYQENIEDVILYNFKTLNGFKNKNGLRRLFESYRLKNINVGVIEPKRKSMRGTSALLRKVNRITTQPFLIVDKIFNIWEQNARCVWSKDKKNVLLYGNLYNLKGVERYFENDYNVIKHSENSYFTMQKSKKFNDYQQFNFDEKDFQKYSANDVEKVLVQDVLEDFNHNVNRYIRGLRILDALNQEYGIHMGVWGNPPIKGFKALAMEYLRSRKIKVIGAQHGSVPGSQRKIWQIGTDFSKCDDYISYGFTNDNLKKLYSGYDFHVNVHPIGMKSPIKRKDRRMDIDILFPITNSVDIFNGGMTRVFPHELNNRQIKILKFLNELKDKNIYIKPFNNTKFMNFSMQPILKNMKNLKIEKNCTFTEFLNKYNPKVIVIEYPSTPLYEALFTDADIFMLNDEINPYGNEALELLKKRVNYFEDVNEMIKELKEYSSMHRKTDCGYFKKYIHPGEMDGKLQDLMRNLGSRKFSTIS
ncbi:MAG: hypothetical protein AB7S78_07615 [Candidatus Omnitrophota bacterium]